MKRRRSKTNPLKVNSHIHGPYSFSAFESVSQAVRLARKQKIAALGLSDFNTVDGHEEFARACGEYGVHPIYNMEIITLSFKDRDNGNRFNDSNPGVMYMGCEALDYPSSFSKASRDSLHRHWQATQSRIKRMIGKVDAYFAKKGLCISLDYEKVRSRFAKNTVRERHVAKAIYRAFIEKHSNLHQAALKLKDFLDTCEEIDMQNAAKTQALIRASLLKAQKPCYEEENIEEFLTPQEGIELALDGGGIPCYPVSIDERARISEFESNAEKLADSLQDMGFHCVEFIPLRNTYEKLKSFALKMHERGFNVIFGTEHNTEEIIPLYPEARNGVRLDEQMQTVAYKGVCILAAHQAMRGKGQDGFVNRKGKRTIPPESMDSFAAFGDEVIRSSL